MLKKSVVEVLELERSFTRFREGNSDSKEGGKAINVDEEHFVYAVDLVAALGVTEEVAEEMIYIADLQDKNAITFTEFRQLVVNWS